MVRPYLDESEVGSLRRWRYHCHQVQIDIPTMTDAFDALDIRQSSDLSTEQ